MKQQLMRLVSPHNTENKFVKVTCTDAASSEVFTELIPIAVVKRWKFRKYRY